MKKTFFKLTYKAFLMLLVFTIFSCQKDEIASPEEMTTEAVAVKYFYDGMHYNKADWDDFVAASKKDKDDYHYTMVQQTVYVFDDAYQNTAFHLYIEKGLEQGETLETLFTNKSDCYFIDFGEGNYYNSAGDLINVELYRYCPSENASRAFVTRLILYKDRSYGGDQMHIYFADYVEEDGYFYGNLQFKRIDTQSIYLPAEFKDEVSSFKYELMIEPDLYAIYGNAIQNYRLVWDVDLVGETSLLNGICTFRKSLAINKNNDGTYVTNRREVGDGNLHNNRANTCGVFRPGNWGDRADYIRFTMTGGQIN
jgi:hypothetical protein